MNNVREFEIWSEGWQATGGSGVAKLIGKTLGENFADACNRLWHQTPDFEIIHGHFDPVKLTVWGCKLFDNPRDAKKSFG